ncbi:MAG: strawberry notch C-terminal domain-containing protein, partial [Candidatus Zixiibacteriota bacterium]
KEIDDFQSGKNKVIIATPESGRTGINLDDTVGDKPRSMIMMTAPFSANEVIQMFGRVNRLKTKSRSDITTLFTDTEVDRWNKGIIVNKMATLGASVSGDYANINVDGINQDQIDQTHKDGKIPFTQDFSEFESLKDYQSRKDKKDKRLEELASGKIEKLNRINEYKAFIPKTEKGEYDFSKHWPNPELNFGKHKGEKMSTKRDYAKWMFDTAGIELTSSEFNKIIFEGETKEEKEKQSEESTFVPVRVSFDDKDKFKKRYSGDTKWDSANRTWMIRKTRHEEFKEDDYFKSFRVPDFILFHPQKTFPQSLNRHNA